MPRFSGSFLVFVLIQTFSRQTLASTKVDGLDNLFNEIGFSPSCVSQALAKCEKSAVHDSPQTDIIVHLESLKKSIDKLNQNQKRPQNCADLFASGDRESGIRKIYLFDCCKNRPVTVFCNQVTDEGGWTVIQHRENLPKRENFFREWIDYRLGFGNLTGEFWLGLDNIHAIVSSTLTELRVDLEDYEGDKRYAKYERFYIEDAKENYRLNLGAYSGNAGDSLTRHNGHSFSTKDRVMILLGENVQLHIKEHGGIHRATIQI